MDRKYFPACCANCYWSDRKSIYYGWISCVHKLSKVRCGNKPCILYMHEDIAKNIIHSKNSKS